MTITIRLVGGLGNQMFQFGAAYSLSRRSGASIAADLTALSVDSQRGYQLDAFRIQARTFTQKPPRLLGRLTRRMARSYSEYANFGSTFDPDFFSLGSDITLNGYFQSWRYLAPQEKEIRAMFALRSPMSAHAKTLSEAIGAERCAISLHVRRGDYLSPGTLEVHGAMPLAYYDRAIAVLRGLLGSEPHYFLFSDDPAWVRKNLSGLGAHTVVEGQDEMPWEDMALMSQCRHHIIANSSFSWWGAWLNPRPDKWVIAPRQWFAPETLREKNICDLLPPEWIAV